MKLLFDIGGTKMRFALSEDNKTIFNKNVFSSVESFEDAINFIKSKRNEITNSNKITSISGGIAGVIENNTLYNAPNLKDWVNKPLAKEFLSIFETKVISIENDAALAGLGEASIGAGKENKIVAYITISTGVGGARIINKQIDIKTFGFEPGHQIIDIDDSSGRFNTLEDLVSGSGIKRNLGKNVSDIKDELFWRDIERKIAYGLNNVILFWNPEVIILGGGIIISGKVNINSIQHNLGKVFNNFPEIPEIKKSELSDEAGLYGALYNSL